MSESGYQWRVGVGVGIGLDLVRGRRLGLYLGFWLGLGLRLLDMIVTHQKVGNVGIQGDHIAIYIANSTCNGGKVNTNKVGKTVQIRQVCAYASSRGRYTCRVDVWLFLL